MIYTIEPEAIVKELHERGAVVYKAQGGRVYIYLKGAQDALRAMRGVMTVRTPGLCDKADLKAKVYGVEAEEKDCQCIGHDEMWLSQRALIVEVG